VAASGGTALPWTDGAAFARKCIALALADREAALQTFGWVFFDRGLIDAATFLAHLNGGPLSMLADAHRYHPRVFMTPPWREIYGADSERRHGFAEAVAEYERLRVAYPSLGYEIVTLPKASPAQRAAFVEAALRLSR
jgi:predicted ATPase